MHRLSIGPCLAIDRTLSIGPCARHCCYGPASTARRSLRGWMRSTPERPIPISTINSVPSAPIARRPPSLPRTWSRWSWACGLPPPRASYRSAPERVSSHAASFGHMMPGPSGPTTMSTWPSVPPDTLTTSRHRCSCPAFHLPARPLAAIGGGRLRAGKSGPECRFVALPAGRRTTWQ
jgi:hypothetical protein